MLGPVRALARLVAVSSPRRTRHKPRAAVPIDHIAFRSPNKCAAGGAASIFGCGASASWPLEAFRQQQILETGATISQISFKIFRSSVGRNASCKDIRRSASLGFFVFFHPSGVAAARYSASASATVGLEAAGAASWTASNSESNLSRRRRRP